MGEDTRSEMGEPVQQRVYSITAERDAEAGVWYVSESDVPGLAVEASTPEELIDLLQELVPELVALNEPSEADLPEVPYNLIFSHLKATRAAA